MNIKEISATQWDALIYKTNYPSIFLLSSWIKIVVKFIGGEYRLIELTVDDSNTILFPIFFNMPWCKNDQYFSIGVVGYGGPAIIGDIILSTNQMVMLENYLGKKCHFLISLPNQNVSELKQTDFVFSSSLTFIFDLPKNEEHLLDLYSGNIRTCIRKALKNEVIIEKINEQNVTEAYNLLVETQKRVSPYITDFDFFKYLALKTDFSFGYIAKKENIISVGVFLFSNFECMHYLNGYSKESAPLCANQLIIYQAMRYAIKKNIKVFNFGESAYANLINAKKKWNGNSSIVYRLKREIS